MGPRHCLSTWGGGNCGSQLFDFPAISQFSAIFCLFFFCNVMFEETQKHSEPPEQKCCSRRLGCGTEIFSQLSRTWIGPSLITIPPPPVAVHQVNRRPRISIQLYKYLESTFGSNADAHFCVSIVCHPPHSSCISFVHAPDHAPHTPCARMVERMGARPAHPPLSEGAGTGGEKRGGRPSLTGGPACLGVSWGCVPVLRGADGTAKMLGAQRSTVRRKGRHSMGCGPCGRVTPLLPGSLVGGCLTLCNASF